MTDSFNTNPVMKPLEMGWTTAPLCQWYKTNARSLPWRENTDPYGVWVSEVMLQQSRVEAVKPYYLRFMERFPTLQILAYSPIEDLLKLWEGLGYYSRARNLHQAANLLVEKWGGSFPQTVEELRTLPGIGEYTAGAIASIAFNQPVAAVDGNVLRVVSRLCAISQDITGLETKRAITQAVTQAYPTTGCGTFTQAVMELGATICIPNGMPKCEECPLQSGCQGFAEGNPAQYPVKPPKKEKREEQYTVFLLCHQGCIALEQRPAKGLLRGLWQFPNQEGFLLPEEVPSCLEDWGLEGKILYSLSPKEHVFTHIRWQMEGYRVECTHRNSQFQWVTPAQLDQKYTLPTAFRKLLSQWR